MSSTSYVLTRFSFISCNYNRINWLGNMSWLVSLKVGLLMQEKHSSDTEKGNDKNVKIIK